MHNRILVATMAALVGLMLILGGALVSPVMAESADGLAAVRNFKLTENYLNRWMAVNREAKNKHVQLLSLRDLMTKKPKSFDKMIAEFDARPGVHDILAHHDMRAKDYLIGTVTIISGLFALVPNAHVSGVSQDNIDFIRAHESEIQQFAKGLGH